MNDQFCDAQELEEAWDNIKIPNELNEFFSSVFALNTEYNREESEEGEDRVKECTSTQERKQHKMKALYHIFYYIAHNGRKENTIAHYWS